MTDWKGSLKTILALAGLVLLLAGPAAALGDITVDYTGGLQHAQPGQTVTLPFRVTNHTSERLQLASEMDLPRGWSTVVSQTDFVIPPQQSHVELVSVSIGNTAPAGNYKPTYRVGLRDEPQVYAEASAEIEIEQMALLMMELIEAPRYIVAGKEAKATLRLTNGSNSETGYDIRMRGFDSWEVKGDKSKGEKLKPGESITIVVRASSDATNEADDTLRLSVTAQTTDLDDNDFASVRKEIDVLGGADVPDPNVYFPVEFQFDTGFSWSNTDRGGRGQSLFEDGIDFDMEAEGPLNADGTLFAKIDWGGALLGNSSNLGTGNWQFAWKPDQQSTVFLGERSFRLGSVIGGGVGRGIEYESQLKPGLNLNAMWMQSDSSFGSDSRMGFRLEWQPGAKSAAEKENSQGAGEQSGSSSGESENGLQEPPEIKTPWESAGPAGTSGLGGARREGESDSSSGEYALTVGNSSTSVPLNGLDDEAEDGETERETLSGTVVALSGRREFGDHFVDAQFAFGGGQAYDLSLGGEIAGFDYRYSRRYGSPDFPGSGNDRRFSTFSLSRRLTENLRIFARQSTSESNLNMDPRRGIATTFDTFSTGLTWNIAQTNLSLSMQQNEEVSRLGDEPVNTDSMQYRLGVGRGFGPINTNFSIGAGEITNKLTGETSDLRTMRGTLSWAINRDLRVAATFTKRNSGSVFEGSAQSTTDTRIDIGYNLTDRSNVDLALRNSDDGIQLVSGVGFSHELRPGHTVSIDLRRAGASGASGGAGDFAINLSYDISEPVEYKHPVGQRDLKGGTLKGRIYEASNPGNGIEGVIVRVGGRSDQTDANGEFQIEYLRPAEHRLYLDRSSYDIDRVPTRDLPVEIVLEAGENEEVKLGLAKAASISGGATIRMVEGEGGDAGLFKAGDETSEADLTEPEPYSGVIVEISREDGDTKRRITGSEGNYEFMELVPGEYNVRVLPSSVPKNYNAEVSTSSFSLKPGEEKTIDVKLSPAVQSLQMLESSGSIEVQTTE